MQERPLHAESAPASVSFIMTSSQGDLFLVALTNIANLETPANSACSLYSSLPPIWIGILAAKGSDLT